MGEHVGGFGRFEYLLDLKMGEDNTLVVRVAGWEHVAKSAKKGRALQAVGGAAQNFGWKPGAFKGPVSIEYYTEVFTR